MLLPSPPSWPHDYSKQVRRGHCPGRFDKDSNQVGRQGCHISRGPPPPPHRMLSMVSASGSCTLCQQAPLSGEKYTTSAAFGNGGGGGGAEGRSAHAGEGSAWIGLTLSRGAGPARPTACNRDAAPARNKPRTRGPLRLVRRHHHQAAAVAELVDAWGRGEMGNVMKECAEAAGHACK